MDRAVFGSRKAASLCGPRPRLNEPAAPDSPAPPADNAQAEGFTTAPASVPVTAGSRVLALVLALQLLQSAPLLPNRPKV